MLIDKGGEFAHGFTYSGHPVACAVAQREPRRIIQQESLVRAHARRDRPVPARSAGASSPSTRWWARRARVGLIGALELVRRQGQPDASSTSAARSAPICRDLCFQNGLIMRAVRDTMIIAPPLVISREQVDELLEKAWRCLDLTLERCRAEGRI